MSLMPLSTEMFQDSSIIGEESISGFCYLKLLESNLFALWLIKRGVLVSTAFLKVLL